MTRTESHSTFPIVLAYCALAALFFAPHLLGLSAFLEGDFTRHYLPYSFFQQKSLLAGNFPVWNPHVNSGHPFLADTESAVFYPVSNILLIITWFSRTVAGRLYWLQFEALIHIVLACCFTALLVHRLTGRRMAGFAAGLVFGFSGYLTGYPPLQLGILRVAVWLPLILWLLLPDESGKTRWTRWLIACAVHAVAFYANHPQTFLFLSYAVAGWMLTLVVVQLRLLLPTGSTGRSVSVAGGSVAARLGQQSMRVVLYAVILLGLTAAQLWPALEYTRLTVRSARPFHELSSGFPFEDTWQFIVPGVLTFYSPLYVGMVGMGLALIAAAALLANRFELSEAASFARPAAIFFLIVGGFALLVSFGEKLPIYPLLYRFAPGWSLFRGQERVAYLVAFSLSVLSGFGFALLPSLAARWRQRVCWGFMVSVAALVALVFIFWQLPSRLEASSAGFLFHAGKSLLIAAVFASLCSALRPTRTRLILLLFVVVVDLFLTSFTLNLADGHEARYALTPPEATATYEAAQTLADETAALPQRVYNERRLPEDSGMFAGWEDVWAASVLRLSTYNTFFESFPVDRMWEVTGVGTVLTWREELVVASQLVEEFPLEDEATRLHRLDSVSPRHWWTQRARLVDDRTALDLLGDPGFDLQKELLIAQADGDAVGYDWVEGRMTLGSGGAASIEVERTGASHLIFRIESDEPGLLFVSENYLPGWQAEWAGADRTSQPADLPIVRAHQSFLGIPVPAGRGTLDLSYRPFSVRWGLAISGASWIILLLALRSPLAGGFRMTWRRGRSFAEKQRAFLSQSFSHGRGQVMASRIQQESCSAKRINLADREFQRITVLLIILVGFALRFYRLGGQELSDLEAFAYQISRLPFLAQFGVFPQIQIPYMVGSFWVQHIWLGVIGTSEFAVRSASALCGTIAVPLAFRLATGLRLSAFTTLAATLLVAVNTYAVWASQDVLLQTLGLVLATCSVILALRILSGRSSRKDFFSYVIVTVVAIYTQFFVVLAFLMQNLFVLFLLARERRPRQSEEGTRLSGHVLRSWAWAQIAIVALTAASSLFGVLPRVVPLGLEGTYWKTWAWLRWMFGRLTLGEYVPHVTWQNVAFLFSLAVVAVAVASALLTERRKTAQYENVDEDLTDVEGGESSESEEAGFRFRGHYGVVLLLLYLLVSLLPVWVAPFFWWSPFYWSFHAIALLPLLFLLAIGFKNIGDIVESHLGWRWRIWAEDSEAVGRFTLAKIPVGGVAAVSLLLLVVAGNLFALRNYHFDPEFTKSRGMRDLAGLLERWSAGLSPANIHFIESATGSSLWYYYTGSVEHSALHSLPGESKTAGEKVNDLLSDGVRRIIHTAPLEGNDETKENSRQALAHFYQLAAQETTGPWLVELYALPDPQEWRLLDVEFVNGLTLERAQVSPNFPPAGGRLVVHMEWSGDPSTLTGGEKFFLHLLDEPGNLVAQWDPELRMDSSQVLVSAAMPIPATLPPGSLRLVAGLYDVTIDGAPRILTQSGEDSLQLAYFHVSDCDVCGR